MGTTGAWWEAILYLNQGARVYIQIFHVCDTYRTSHYTSVYFLRLGYEYHYHLLTLPTVERMLASGVHVRAVPLANASNALCLQVVLELAFRQRVYVCHYFVECISQRRFDRQF